MHAICTPLRALTPYARLVGERARGAVPLFAALLALGLSGCSIVFPPDGCPSLEDLCPALECADGFAVNDDGCAMCECAAPPSEPTVCWDDAECGDGQRCDVDSFCEPPPGCVDGEPCPAVCYGRCVDVPDGCSSDGDCGAGERCVFDDGSAPTEPAPEPAPADAGSSEDRVCEPNDAGTCGGGGEQDPPSGGLVAPEGSCVPASCSDERPAIGCPEGSEVVIDFSEDPCGVLVCVDRDECRDLDPNLCEQVFGCHLEEVPAPCECAPGQDCGSCMGELVCVADDATACEQLSDEQCLARSDCELVSDGGAAPCFQECDDAGTCTGDCDMPEPDGGSCVTRDAPPPPPDGDCFSDVDCAAGQFCDVVDECGSVCEPNEPCTDICQIVGFCTDLPVEPPSCSGDDECGLGYVCEQTEVCACEGSGTDDSADPPQDAGAPAPCLEVCEVVGQCVWNPDNTSCFFDGDCGETQHCQYFDSCMAPPDCPGCLIACEGVCVDNAPEPVACVGEQDCAEGQICTAGEVCNQNPSCVDGQACTDECWGFCEDPAPVVSDKCLEEADCAEGYRCASEVDSCYCPDGEACDVCYWQCVPDDNTAP